MNVYNFSFKFCSSILVNLLNCCVKTKCVLFLLKKIHVECFSLANGNWRLGGPANNKSLHVGDFFTCNNERTLN